MIDRIFSAVLTFTLLAGGTIAIGSALFGVDRATTPARTAAIELPRVEITARRSLEVIAARSSDSVDPKPRVQ